jgi:cellobiose phosphorylase
MATNTPSSKIYPCLPEYFNAQGQGMYSYLTGSASWFMLTLLTQVFGIRGSYGDLMIEPKLTAGQFCGGNTLAICCTFANKRITVKYRNPGKKEYGNYRIADVCINGRMFANGVNGNSLRIDRRSLLSRLHRAHNIIEITLK